MDPELDVLRSFLRHPSTRALFTRFIEAHNKRDLIGLKLLDQVQACKLIQDSDQRARQAVEARDPRRPEALGGLHRRDYACLRPERAPQAHPGFLEVFGTRLLA